VLLACNVAVFCDCMPTLMVLAVGCMCIRRQSDGCMQVLIVRTDGGPDRNNLFASVQLASLALARELNVQLLVSMRTAPGQSFTNQVERTMSTLNLGLQGLSLARNAMPVETERLVKNANSMKAVRKALADADAKLPAGISTHTDNWAQSLEGPKQQVAEAFNVRTLLLSLLCKLISSACGHVCTCAVDDHAVMFTSLTFDFLTCCITLNCGNAISGKLAKLLVTVQRLQWSGEAVQVLDPDIVQETAALYGQLEALDSAFDRSKAVTKDALKSYPQLRSFMEEHTRSSQYMFQYMQTPPQLPQLQLSTSSPRATAGNVAVPTCTSIGNETSDADMPVDVRTLLWYVSYKATSIKWRNQQNIGTN
jgi:hypothetical protein